MNNLALKGDSKNNSSEAYTPMSGMFQSNSNQSTYFSINPESFFSNSMKHPSTQPTAPGAFPASYNPLGSLPTTTSNGQAFTSFVLPPTVNPYNYYVNLQYIVFNQKTEQTFQNLLPDLQKLLPNFHPQHLLTLMKEAAQAGFISYRSKQGVDYFGPLTESRSLKLDPKIMHHLILFNKWNTLKSDVVQLQIDQDTVKRLIFFFYQMNLRVLFYLPPTNLGYSSRTASRYRKLFKCFSTICSIFNHSCITTIRRTICCCDEPIS